MNKNNSKSIYSARKTNARLPRKRFLMVCEGKETEPNYVKYFQVEGRNYQTASIEIKDLGAMGITVVQKAKKLKEQGNCGNHEVWCVFDRDLKQENNNQQNFNYEYYESATYRWVARLTEHS